MLQFELKNFKNRYNTTIIFVTDENEAKANATSQVSTRRKTQRIET
jgi:ABC-type proline/glycine betaine transport system ATPase subunit